MTPAMRALLADGSAQPLMDLNFRTGQYRVRGQRYGTFAGIPGASMTRASTKYVTSTAGILSPVPTGVLGVSDAGALVEEARTNLVLWSQDFSNAAYTKSGATITTDAAVAPDGSTTADEVALASRSGTAQFVVQKNNISAGTYAGSLWVKAKTAGDVGKVIDLWQFDGVNRNVTSVTLTANWVRAKVTISVALGASATAELISFGRLSSNPDNTAVSFYAWQAQGELGAFVTSEIPTTTTTATRAADVATVTLPSGLVGSSYAFVSWNDMSAGDGILRDMASTSDGTSNNSIIFRRRAINELQVFATSAGAAQTQAIGASGKTGARVIKTSVRASPTSYIAAVDGVIGSEVSVTMPANPTQINIGSSIASVYSNSYVQRVLMVKMATNEQIKAWTQ